jgi:hypothetical protein
MLVHRALLTYDAIFGWQGARTFDRNKLHIWQPCVVILAPDIGPLGTSCIGRQPPSHGVSRRILLSGGASLYSDQFASSLPARFAEYGRRNSILSALAGACVTNCQVAAARRVRRKSGGRICLLEN